MGYRWVSDMARIDRAYHLHALTKKRTVNARLIVRVGRARLIFTRTINGWGIAY